MISLSNLSRFIPIRLLFRLLVLQLWLILQLMLLKATPLLKIHLRKLELLDFNSTRRIWFQGRCRSKFVDRLPLPHLICFLHTMMNRRLLNSFYGVLIALLDTTQGGINGQVLITAHSIDEIIFSIVLNGLIPLFSISLIDMLLNLNLLLDGPLWSLLT